MALFELCGINSRANFKTTEDDNLNGEMDSLNIIGNPTQLALPPLGCVSFCFHLLAYSISVFLMDLNFTSILLAK